MEGRQVAEEAISVNRRRPYRDFATTNLEPSSFGEKRKFRMSVRGELHVWHCRYRKRGGG